uniref:Helix-turn-helix domain-containing protein n=1 Tax=Streptomyces sp. NBC_00093 TaxID=2975649 RepID=A0AAU2AHC2_9ACTN
MSGVDATAYVMRLKMRTPAHKLALLAVAARCDQQYSCFPSRSLVAGEALVSEERAKTILRDLRRDGYLSARTRRRENGSNTSNRYYVHGPWDRWNDTGKPFPEIEYYLNRDDRYATVRDGEFIPRPHAEKPSSGEGVADDPPSSATGGVTDNPPGGGTSNPPGGLPVEPPPGVTHAPPVTNHCEPANEPVSANGGSVRPSVQVEHTFASETDGRTGAVDSEGKQEEARPTAEGSPQNGSSEGAVPGEVWTAAGRRQETTPGMEVLARVGRLNETFKLAGKPFIDQARELDIRFADSEAAGDVWRVSDLVSILSAPLGSPIRVSAAAVIADRIRKLPRTPRSAMLPMQPTGGGQPPAREWSVPDAADRTVNDSITRRTRGECPECRADSPGGDLCGPCQGWPTCEAGCGRAVRGGGVCEPCENAAYHATIATAPGEDGKCAGHGGEPCGRPVVTLGMCRRCRVKAEESRNTVVADWEAARDQIVAAATAAEERQPDHAPF